MKYIYSRVQISPLQHRLLSLSSQRRLSSLSQRRLSSLQRRLSSSSSSLQRRLSSSSSSSLQRRLLSSLFTYKNIQPRKNIQPQTKIKPQFINNNFDPRFEFKLQSWGETPVGNSDTSWPKEMGPVLVVSIRPERMKQFSNRMGSWMQHMRRFPATDGRTINATQWVRSRKANSMMTSGRLGCYDSHVRIWETISQSHFEVVTVLEDDVDWTYDRNIVKQLKQSFQKLKNNKWDFLAWGHGPWANEKNTPTNIENWHQPGTCQGFFAYTITRKFAQELLQHCRPYRGPAIDKWFYDSFIKSKACEPFVVLTAEPSLCWVVPVESDTMKRNM